MLLLDMTELSTDYTILNSLNKGLVILLLTLHTFIVLFQLLILKTQLFTMGTTQWSLI